MLKKISVLFLLLNTFLFAQESKVSVDLSSPYRTIFTHLHFLQPESYNATNASKTIYGESSEQSVKIAIKK